ncbi:hypothetical protein [Synechocystis sp. PCC 7338]|uniref:hypothetical protein n=1 Tax=Synechocystis sp. PCC 7338 TaxID=2732530 RepID=UPI001BB01B6D|nr:hypothetical protein [Synechocystis sp. PCC 7338]QUS61118.1 hypothetical protein HTZ78_10865 [Synechocystis sp. PCC 7338]
MSEHQSSLSSSFYSNLDTILQSVLGDDILLAVNHAVNSYVETVNKCQINYADVQDDDIKNQLEDDNKMMLIARSRNDFVEYCKCATLSIESVLRYFKDINKNNYEVFFDNNNFPYKSKYIELKFWFDFMNENRMSQEYWDLECILRLRDATSHRKLGLADVEQMIREFNNRNAVIRDKTILFYKNRNFEKVKNRTEWLIKKTLVNLQILR